MSKLVPEVRFKEFSREWEEKLLQKICKINPATTEIPNKFVYIDLESVKNGKLLQKKEILKENAPSRAQRLLEQNDVIYQMVRPYQKNNLFFNFNDNHYVASTGYAQLRAYNSPNFLYQLVHIDNFVNKVLDKSTGTNYPAINSKDLANIKIFIPSTPQEQQKIADTFSSLNNLIEAHTKKLELLKEHKKGLMQKLFPTDDERVPEVRFKEFSGEWEEKKLKNVVSYFKGFAFKSKDYTYSGRRIVRVSDMGFDYIKEIDQDIYLKEEEAKKYTKWKLQEDDLIVTTVGSKPPMYDSLVGRTIVVKYKDKGFLLNQNAVCLRGNENIYQNFLNILFKRSEYITFVESIIRGNANQGSITLENLFKYKLYIPSFPEQQKIADTLSSLDNLIEAQNKKIEFLKDHKKGLMQKMFVSEELEE